MGRRKGIEDPDLADRVGAACSDGRTSLSKISRDIGVAPSTLSRAVRSRRFSRKLQIKLNHHLGRGLAPKGGENAALAVSLQKALQLINELQDLMPDLQKRLVAALDT
ncbi:hypothetical protein [Methylorubrum aminovorans]|uniref:hypothetical protein n=1 Tax=Methylorubrum aminovorans TaxID=269069 RepID=UPI001EDD7715|nr:hypothetical protein [Methylorubrum aminovorans]GMA77849.1 hypothetical protein GCM10025880_42660 [Methylorubrum aminovorans]